MDTVILILYMPKLADELFWDCRKPLSDEEWRQYGTAVIERVLEYGDLQDFQEIVKYYGRDRLRAVFVSSRRISERVRSFGLALFGDEILKEGNRCTPQSSVQKLWPY